MLRLPINPLVGQGNPFKQDPDLNPIRGGNQNWYAMLFVRRIEQSSQQGA
jgi:hypothetical protein